MTSIMQQWVIWTLHSLPQWNDSRDDGKMK